MKGLGTLRSPIQIIRRRRLQKFSESHSRASAEFWGRPPEPTCRQRARQILKRGIIAHYSSGAMKCGVCGFDDIRALSIDHINGGGGKHLREIGDFYSWLKKNSYPSGYQVLCMNCQWIKKMVRYEMCRK
jgi:hypothetical protein